MNFTARLDRMMGLALLLSIGLLTSCLDNEEEVTTTPADDITITVEADKSKIQAKENSLNEQKEVLLGEQQDIRKQRDELRKRYASISAKDKKMRKKLEQEEKRLELQEGDLFKRQRQIESERNKLARQKNDLLETIAKMTMRKGGLTIEQREQLIAKRETSVAKRERGLASREAKLAEREKQVTEQLAKLVKLMEELKSAASGMSSKTVIVQAAPSGGKATAKTSRRQYNRARATMTKKGVLEADLPDNGRSALSQYRQATKEKDYQSAQDAADRLNSVIDALEIDASFIQRKFNRIRALADGRQLGSEEEQLLNQVTAAFTNAKYSQANSKLNQLYRKLKQ